MTYPGGTVYPSSTTYPGASSSGRVQVTTMASNTPPRVLVTLSGFTGASITVYRVDASGAATPVRNGNPIALTSGGQVLYDYEAPFNQPISYRAASNTGDLDSSGVVEMVVMTPWLINPGVPSLSVPLTIVSRGDRTSATNQGVHWPLGRSKPIVIGDGARHADAFDMVVRTESIPADQALANLMNQACVMLLQVAYSTTSRSLYEWISVDQVTCSDQVAWLGTPALLWTLGCQITDAPSGLLQAQFAWSDVVAQYATWNDVLNAYATWQGVVTNTPGT